MTPILTLSAPCAAVARADAASAASKSLNPALTLLSQFVRRLCGTPLRAHHRSAELSTQRASIGLQLAQEGRALGGAGEHEREVGAGEHEAHALLDVARHQLLV